MAQSWWTSPGEGAYFQRLAEVTPRPDAPEGRVVSHPIELPAWKVTQAAEDALRDGKQALILPSTSTIGLFELRTASHDSSSLVREANRFQGRSEHHLGRSGDSVQHWLDQGHRVWLRNSGPGTLAILSSAPFMWAAEP